MYAMMHEKMMHEKMMQAKRTHAKFRAAMHSLWTSTWHLTIVWRIFALPAVAAIHAVLALLLPRARNHRELSAIAGAA
jgi:anti-sigma-K factor RskA